jgi:endonuclease YncB( thermonuclease family)
MRFVSPRHLLLALALVLMSDALAARELYSYALVRDDGSLQIKGRIVHLFGVYLPPSDRKCRSNVRPVRCGPRAALELDSKIQGFVRCELQNRNEDGSFDAICYVDSSSFSEGEDLAAYLLSWGWAVALPDAPFEYHVLERIARERGLGIWGLQVDNVIRRRRH